MSFAGKTAIVTGAGRGIGHSVALALGREGCRVVVHYGASREKAEATARQIEASGGEAFALGADLRFASQIAAFYQEMDRELIRRTGEARIDILVNAAGMAGFGGSVAEMSEEAFDEIFDLNVKGSFFMCQHAAARLNDHGRVVNFSSMASRLNGKAPVAYKMAKRAVNAMTEYFAGEMAARSVTVNAVSPGPTDTDMMAKSKLNPDHMRNLLSHVAMGRMGQPEEVAAFVVMLCRPEAGWVTGQVIECSGGMDL